MPRKPRKPDIWKTQSFSDTMRAFQHAYTLRREHSLSVITAPAGRGKSFAAQVFVEQHPDCVLVELLPRVFATVRKNLDQVIDQLGIDRPEPWAARVDVAHVIVAEMERRGGVLILDEADRLDKHTADGLRWMAEESGLQICLIGCPTVEAVLRRHAPLQRRVGWRWEIKPIGLDDLTDTIPQTFPREALKQIIVETRGNIGDVETLIARCREVKSDRGHAGVTPKLVKRIARQFLVRPYLPPLDEDAAEELGLTVDDLRQAA